MGPGDIGRHHRRHVLGTTRDLCRLERRAEARVRRVQDDLGALEHHAPCNFGHHEFAAGNDADAAKRRVGHREHLVIGRDLQVIGHEIVDRREGCGVDPAIAAQDLAIRADQDAGVEVTARPFLGGLEHVPCDIDAFAPCQRLQRLGQRPGHGRTGPPHPVGHRHAQRRALHGELGEHHQVGAVGPGQRLFDQPDKSRLVPRDHPGRGPVVGARLARSPSIWIQVARQGAMGMTASFRSGIGLHLLAAHQRYTTSLQPAPVECNFFARPACNALRSAERCPRFGRGWRQSIHLRQWL